LVAGVLLATILFQAASPASNEELQRGKNAYDRGEFGRAIEIVRPLLYPDIHLQSDGQIVQAHRILGVSYLFEKDQEDATKEFRKLLQLSPDYRFDPLLDPPEVVDFFNTVRKEYSTELAELEARRKELEQAKQRDREECAKVRQGPTVIEKHVGRNAFAVNFVPFGAGQFQNGHRRKGWAFLGAEAVLGAISVGAFATNLYVYGFRPRRTCIYDYGDMACPASDIDHTDENRSRWLTRVQVASGAMFFGAAIWGILDAIYYYQPETVSWPPPSSNHLSNNASTVGKLHISPVLMNHALGPGLSFRF
jgi:hypothetical protein